MSMSKKTFVAAGLLAGLLAGSMAFAQTANLEALDRSHDNDNPDNQLYYHLQVENNGTAAVSLNQVTVRYWFTDNGDKTPLEFDCDYAQLTCANITHKFVTLATPVTGANMYLELGFTAAAGMLQPGTSTGEIQTRTHHTNFSNFNTTASYSFISDPSFVYKPSATITVYVNGTLVWGVEPK
jgi:endo-1,4-beta-xylanase